jgi:hypothetical protein
VVTSQMSLPFVVVLDDVLEDRTSGLSSRQDCATTSTDVCYLLG